MKNAIMLCKTKVKAGRSKLGGRPNLPKDIEWPVNPDGREMDFLAQIHCAELPGGTKLPSKGTLFFFVDCECLPWGGYNSEEDRGHWRIVYIDGKLPKATRANPRKDGFWQCPGGPAGRSFRECFLSFRAIESHDQEGAHGDDPYGYGPRHQMLGHPYWIQGGYGDPGMLLLQLDSDCGDDFSPGWMWGDVGILYFFIGPDDLEKRNFDAAEAYIECC